MRFVSMPLAAIASALLLFSPVASATPADSQFLNEVSMYVTSPVNSSNAQLLTTTAKKACQLLSNGYNSTQAMDYAKSQLGQLVSDRIGFMIAATRSYCSQYFAYYNGA